MPAFLNCKQKVVGQKPIAFAPRLLFTKGQSSGLGYDALSAANFSARPASTVAKCVRYSPEA